MGDVLNVELNADSLPNLRLLAKIGEGGMSTVWRAVETDTGREIAVKVLDTEYAASEDDVRAFRSEERLMAEISHPGVVKAYALNEANGIWYLTMELVRGYTFADFLRRKLHVCEGDCLLICESVAATLDTVWNDHGVIHCDLKPENIMINADGIVKLTDLGISQRFNLAASGLKDVSEHVLGTPAYISPEQVYGDVELDCRSDIYSLAATLYHLATGHVLFPGLDNEGMMRAHCNEQTQANDPRAYRGELSEGFAQMLEAMLVKDRDYRLSDWKSVLQMCQDVESGLAFKPRGDAAVSSIRLI